MQQGHGQAYEVITEEDEEDGEVLGRQEEDRMGFLMARRADVY